MWTTRSHPREKMMRKITRMMMAAGLAGMLMAPLPLAAQDAPNPAAELRGFWLTTSYPDVAWHLTARMRRFGSDWPFNHENLDCGILKLTAIAGKTSTVGLGRSCVR